LITGAAVSGISVNIYKFFLNVKPSKSTVRLRTYTGELMPVVVEIDVEVRYG